MTKIDPHKYSVFKTEELDNWINWAADHLDDGGPPFPERLKDAVVIRQQDVFAHSALYAYASSIQTALEIMDMHNSLDPDVREYLLDIADYFASMADGSIVKRKLPD